MTVRRPLKVWNGTAFEDVAAAQLGAHYSSHATGGSDALTPADIGAAPAEHVHTAEDIIGGGGTELSLPTEGVLDGSVLAYSITQPRITAELGSLDSWTATEANNTATVLILADREGSTVVQETIDVVVTPAVYSSAATAAAYGAVGSPRGVIFGAEDQRCYVELDVDVYPATEGLSLVISGPAALAMGFTTGQASDPASGEWVAALSEHLPGVDQIRARVEALEQSVGTGGGAALSSVRRRRSTYWYAAGPPGAVGTLVAVAGTAYALRIPGLGAGDVINGVALEIGTALGAGLTGEMDFYIAAPQPTFEYPGILGARLATYTFTSADTSRVSITAQAPYTCPEDGDYWAIVVLRSGTSPTLRAHIQNTTVGFGSDPPGTPGVSTLGAPGYRHTAFPANVDIVADTTAWTSSVDPSSSVPRIYFRMG